MIKTIGIWYTFNIYIIYHVNVINPHVTFSYDIIMMQKKILTNKIELLIIYGLIVHYMLWINKKFIIMTEIMFQNKPDTIQLSSGVSRTPIIEHDIAEKPTNLNELILDEPVIDDMLPATLTDKNVNAMTGDKAKVKLTMTNFKVVATWKYSSENHECMLCHKDLMIPVHDVGFNRLSGDVRIGTCEHGFHAYCVDTWFAAGNISCPYCQTTWKSAKTVGSSVYVYKNTTLDSQGINPEAWRSRNPSDRIFSS
jgi:hypothetical protein